MVVEMVSSETSVDPSLVDTTMLSKNSTRSDTFKNSTELDTSKSLTSLSHHKCQEMPILNLEKPSTELPDKSPLMEMVTGSSKEHQAPLLNHLDQEDQAQHQELQVKVATIELPELWLLPEVETPQPLPHQVTMPVLLLLMPDSTGKCS